MQNKFSSVFCRPGGLGADTFWQGRVGLSKTKLWGILLAPFPFEHAHVFIYPVPVQYISNMIFPINDIGHLFGFFKLVEQKNEMVEREE